LFRSENLVEQSYTTNERLTLDSAALRNEIGIRGY